LDSRVHETSGGILGVMMELRPKTAFLPACSPSLVPYINLAAKKLCTFDTVNFMRAVAFGDGSSAIPDWVGFLARHDTNDLPAFCGLTTFLSLDSLNLAPCTTSLTVGFSAFGGSVFVGVSLIDEVKSEASIRNRAVFCRAADRPFDSRKVLTADWAMMRRLC
ncbi:hypothetical protein KCV07_g293, partial [Aureobasidium melanogenum]